MANTLLTDLVIMVSGLMVFMFMFSDKLPIRRCVYSSG